MGEVGEGLDKVWEAGQDGYNFGKEHLEEAVAEFRRRERRYGGIGR